SAIHAGRFSDAQGILRRVEEATRSQRAPFLLAATLRLEARAVFETDRPIGPAFSALDEAAAILRDAGDLGGVADIECEKSQVPAFRGDEKQFAEGRAHLEKAIALFRRQGNSERAYWWLGSIANQALHHGRIKEADDLLREAKDEVEAGGGQAD